MAKKSKVVSAGVNVQLLLAIAAGQVTHISQADGMPLLQHDPQLIEVNTAVTDAEGKALVRLTDAGKVMANQPASAPSEAKASPYSVLKGVEIPASKRGNHKGGGAPTQYPFETMEIGDSFFVPVSAKHPDPVKTLGSTVSSANMKFSEKTGETKTVTRTKRGDGNKAALDAAGNKIKETVTVDVYKATRKFVIRAVEKGKTYGTWVAPENGALIARVALSVE